MKREKGIPKQNNKFLSGMHIIFSGVVKHDFLHNLSSIFLYLSTAISLATFSLLEPEEEKIKVFAKVVI